MMRRDHRKLRTGCKQCKKRRVKCDEAKPTCINCIRNKLQSERARHVVPLRLASHCFTNPSCYTPAHVPRHTWSRTLTSLYFNNMLHICGRETNFPLAKKISTNGNLARIPHARPCSQFQRYTSQLYSHNAKLNSYRAESEHLGLPSFRDFVSNEDPQNIHAVTAFAGFVVPYLVVCDSGSTSIGRIHSLHDEHPHWFFAFRGLLQMVGRSWMHLRARSFSPLLVPGHPTFGYAGNPDDTQLARLQQLLEPSIYCFGKEREDLAAFKTALEELRRLCSCLPKPITAVKTQVMIAIHVWPGIGSQRFVEILDERRPEALILLAHYCVLLKKVHSYWWLEGVGERLLMAIDRELSPEWRPWIEWVLEHPIC